MNNRMTILGIDPKFGLSILLVEFQNLSKKLILMYFKIKIFLSDCFQ